MDKTQTKKVKFVTNPDQKEDIQYLVAAARKDYKILHHIWCSPKDYKEEFKVRGVSVIPKGGCPQGKLMFFYTPK